MDLKSRKRRFRRKLRRRAGNVKAAVRKFGTLNLILVLVFLYLLVFNEQMIRLYAQKGSAPESAWCALIAALLGECGICGWIKTTKEKRREQEGEEPEGMPGQTPEPENNGPPEEGEA